MNSIWVLVVTFMLAGGQQYDHVVGDYESSGGGRVGPFRTSYENCAIAMGTAISNLERQGIQVVSASCHKQEKKK